MGDPLVRHEVPLRDICVGDRVIIGSELKTIVAVNREVDEVTAWYLKIKGRYGVVVDGWGWETIAVYR